MIEVIPAYGRDYSAAVSAKADWFAGKDFLEASSRLACNVNDFPGQDVLIRYARHTKVAHLEFAKDKRAYDKAKAADRATRPVFDDFDGWLKSVDAECIKRSGLSIYDLPDWDFRAEFDNGASPAHVAKNMLADEGFFD